ncbi:hypothetical protein RYX36_012370 [Vicia faba]
MSELEYEVALGTYLEQSQVKIMGATADVQNQGRTIVDINLVPLGEKFDNTTAALTYERLWHKKVPLNKSLFGDYVVVYITYPGIPSSPSYGTSIGGGPSENADGSLPVSAYFASKNQKTESDKDGLEKQLEEVKRINPDLSSTWKNLLAIFQTSSEKDKPRGVAAADEDSSIDFGDFFNGPLPGKFLKLLRFLALSRLGVYIPLGGVNRDAFLGNLDQNSLLTTLDSFSGGGIGRLGICSLGIVPFINAHIVFQLLAQVYPKLQDLQKKEGEAGRKKILQYTRYASIGFAIVQAIGQVLFLRPYANDFTIEWAITSVILLTLGSVFTTYIGEKITELKLGNGTSLLIFTNIISYLPASFGRTFSQAFSDANYVGLVTIILSFFLLVLGIVYVREEERKIPINYASRFTSRSGGLEKSAYLPFKVNSSAVMPIIFSVRSVFRYSLAYHHQSMTAP